MHNQSYSDNAKLRIFFYYYYYHTICFYFFFMCSVVACIEYYVVFNYYSFLFSFFIFWFSFCFCCYLRLFILWVFMKCFFFLFFFFLQCIVNKIHSFLIVAPHKFIPHNLICSNLMNQMDKNLIFLTLCCYFFCFVCFIWSEIWLIDSRY